MHSLQSSLNHSSLNSDLSEPLIWQVEGDAPAIESETPGETCTTGVNSKSAADFNSGIFTFGVIGAQISPKEPTINNV